MKKQERSRASFFDSQTFCRGGKNGVTAAPNQASGSKSRQHQGGEKKKTVLSLSGIHLTCTEHPPFVLSGCFLSSPLLLLRAVWKLRMNHRDALLCARRPASHTVPVNLCSQAGGLLMPSPARLKKKKIQSWPKLK